MLTTESSWLKYIILTSLFQITFVGNYQNRDLAVNKVLLEGGKKQNDTILMLIKVTVELSLCLITKLWRRTGSGGGTVPAF